ncbi:MAG: hypothetical protein Q8Q33_03315 [Chlamydiota bacterium]|nr:hypothetical protein [Chlamydiota bacterium]
MPRLPMQTGLILFIMCFCYAAQAGSGYHLDCTHCNYSTEVFFGQGKLSKRIANGFCAKCQKFVGISERINEKNDNAQPIGHVFFPGWTQYKALYACPTCQQPFLEITESDLQTQKESMLCPVCLKNGLQATPGIQWD